jgi:hypothetical protein
MTLSIGVVTTDATRLRLLAWLQEDLRAQAIELTCGTIEAVLDAYDRRTKPA